MGKTRRWHEHHFNVVLLGDAGVGKTCLLDRWYETSSLGEVYRSFGGTFGSKTVYLYYRYAEVVFRIWDIAGLQSLHKLTALVKVHSAIIMYDITRQDSLRIARELLDILRSEFSPDIFKALAGNKADLVSEREVTFEDGLSCAHDNDVDLFMEVSALTSENVEKLFFTIAEQLVRENALTRTISEDSKALNLEGKSLLRIPATVTEQTEVEVLNLSHNELTRLPTSTSNLANLTALNLSHNKLTQFPEVVVTLINLTHLFVNDNQLSSLPANLENLKKLEELELRNNKMKNLCKSIVNLNHLKELSVADNPLVSEEITRLMMLTDSRNIFTDIAAPPEIQSQRDVEKLLYEKALKEGSVNVYRGRVLLVGQDRAGKTSLKKSLLGLPFNPKEQSTEGIEVDPSVCEIEVDQVKNWNSTTENKPSLAEFSEDISRMLAEKQYHWMVDEAKKDSKMESELELTEEESAREVDKNSSDMNQVPEDVGYFENSTISPPEIEMRVQAIAENALDDVTDNGRGNSSKDSTLMIDATSPPDGVTKHAYLRLGNMLRDVHGDAENADDKRETIVTVDLWDFAGQHLYYASHPVFLSSRAVYILVHNLSKALDAPAQPCVRQGTHDVILENPNNETNLENLLSWLVTIHSIRPTGEEMVGNSDGMLRYLRPPVFIVGTHADKPFEDIKATTSKIQQEIFGKEYEKHVIRPFFSIDNTLGKKSYLNKILQLFGLAGKSEFVLLDHQLKPTMNRKALQDF